MLKTLEAVRMGVCINYFIPMQKVSELLRTPVWNVAENCQIYAKVNNIRGGINIGAAEKFIGATSFLKDNVRPIKVYI